MKIYNKTTKEIRWEDDISPMLEEVWLDITETLAQKHLDGHNEYDQWLMMVEHDLHKLMLTLREREYSLSEMASEHILFE